MNDEYDFSNDFNKADDIPINRQIENRPREVDKNLPSSDKNSLRNLTSMQLAGGTVSPAKIGNTYGVRYSAKFKEGGKVKDKSAPQVSSASKRADGIAQRGKTKGRYL
jgi:hypothetical protein